MNEWHKGLRKTFAKYLARIALKIDPECKEAHEFYEKQLFDVMVDGEAISRIDYSSFKDRMEVK